MHELCVMLGGWGSIWSTVGGAEYVYVKFGRYQGCALMGCSGKISSCGMHHLYNGCDKLDDFCRNSK